jgi:hypothetical protein
MYHLTQAPENNIRAISNIFRKFLEIFASQGAPTVANFPLVPTTPVENFATSTAGVVDTNGKFFTSGKIQAANLLPVSTTPSGK